MGKENRESSRRHPGAVVSGEETPLRPRRVICQCAAALWVLAGILWLRGAISGKAALAAAAVVAAASAALLACPKAGRRFAGAADAFGRRVSHRAGQALLLAVFFFVIAPLGLALRLLGKDPLAKRIDRAAASYWSPPTRDGGLDRMW